MISLPPKIERDIQGKQTFLVPLIVIAPESDDPIYISTNKGVFGGQYYEDRNLKVGTIKESVNLEQSKFKINSVSLTLSNFPVSEKRFSDFVFERGLLNASLDIYYKSQSCQTLEDCVLVYRGNIKRFTHSDKTCNIQIEDKTEDKLNQELPKANTGYRKDVYSKDYLNTPIPMLYGRVDKAPAIPFIEQESISSNSKIIVTCDDTLGSDPRIVLGNFFNDDATQPFLDENPNPLFIYKDDYFQVLQNYNFDVITDDTENWSWMEYDQYTLVDNQCIEILKKYENLTPKNPPSNNELQAVKLRFPNNFLSLPNPTDGDTEWADSDNFGVSYEEPVIKSPEFAYDNPFFSESVSNQYVINPINYKESSAKVPDTTLTIEDETNFILQDFQPSSDIGIYNNVAEPSTTGSNLRSQYEVMSFLQRYAHKNNDIDNPRIQFIRLPSGNAIQERLNVKLRELYENQTGRTILGEPEMVVNNANLRIDAAASLNKDFYLNWAQAQPFDNMDWFTDNYTVDVGLSFFGSTSEAGDGAMWSELTVTDPRSFYYLHNDGSAQGRTDAINFPNLFIRFELSTGTLTGNTGSMSSPAVIFNTPYVSTSLENGNIANYNDPSVGIYFDLIEIGSGRPSLFTEDELAIYTPLELTYKTRVGSGNRSQVTKYDCAWNGTPFDNTDSNLTNFGTSSPYFGYYTASDWTSTTYIQTQSYILPSSSIGANSGWCMWVRQDIQNGEIGSNSGYGTITGEKNYEASNLRISANTLIPMANLNKVYSNHGSYRIGIDFNTGIPLNLDADKITINNPTNTSSRRYGAVFPFNDQDISDDIRTDTFFSGKIKLIFDTENTTNATDAFLKVNLGAMDVKAETFDIDWSVFDDNLDGSSATLINQSLSECISNTNTYYDTFDQSPDITNENPNTFNHYTELQSITDEFHSVNNYNALGMFFRLDGNVDPVNIARFNLEINSISMLHYIVFEAALDSPMYINSEGRINLPEESINTTFKYTGQVINNPDDISLIEKPCDIIYHMVEKELNLIDSIDLDRLEEARNELIILDSAFSVNETIKAKALIEKICQSSNIFALFKSTSDLSFISIKQEYSSSDMTIKSKDIISYSFTRTPVEKVNTIVNVKYKKDYAEDEMLEETGYCDGYDFYGNADLGYDGGYSYDYLGLDREDKVLEFECDVIRTKGSAMALRDFIYKYNCNQHNIIKFKLPIQYLQLEVGDVIDFDSLIGDVRVYGEDYTVETIRNGQVIYPYFIIDSINKSQRTIDVQATQLHKLTHNFSAQLGSITRTVNRSQSIGLANTVQDFDELEEFLLNQKQYYTTEQKRVSDINNDGYIDNYDLMGMQDLINAGQFNLDVNDDGIVNVVDIVALINTILSNDELSEEVTEIFDANQDGTVDVIDVVLAVNQILED